MELKDLLAPQLVRLGVRAGDWRQAVMEAGRLLVAGGIAMPRYVEAMIRTVESLGPYMVIAPGIAMPHARPEDGVSRTGLAFVRLDVPVAFGHGANDPVDLVIPLAAVDHDAHVMAMAQLAEQLAKAETLRRVREAKTPDEAWRALTGVEDRTERV
ncbi:PTS sugar transporter subunit IIA [Thermaerobacter subterraneus]|uniref:Ascorbate-specific PTS system EIIA component n=1 Tax=Thermaerobacter subterraneus DSM 13965 TaxID=867903 RepID=K6P267_9FIRM|nr:PTS sugar transporter subunit IIA [Thermaerobacter subterraneus]EKP95160.1 phosphotransferase system mannitol/fructose-specifc IIA component (Ntr-type) [Thermaerobacter subterraneus DSM 13965]